MTVTTYQGWLADGSPWRDAPVIETFAQLMRSHGFTVYTIGNESHLTADPPEDHTPFSHTAWPGPQPYPLVMALDVMPGGAVDWQLLGAEIVGARRNATPGTEWIKYVNFTDRGGACWHASWEPGYAIRSSTDLGHIHISARTDYAQLTDLRGWDPVATLLAGGAPATTPQEDPVLNQWTNVAKGTTGQAAKIVEGLLIGNGFPVGCDPTHLDGIIGPVCDNSIKDFQGRHGLQVDGVVGPHTLSTLLLGRDVA